jgi:hypothetical protein
VKETLTNLQKPLLELKNLGKGGKSGSVIVFEMECNIKNLKFP